MLEITELLWNQKSYLCRAPISSKVSNGPAPCWYTKFDHAAQCYLQNPLLRHRPFSLSPRLTCVHSNLSAAMPKTLGLASMPIVYFVYGDLSFWVVFLTAFLVFDLRKKKYLRSLEWLRLLTIAEVVRYFCSATKLQGCPTPELSLVTKVYASLARHPLLSVGPFF